jgi:hypothetical protein
MIKRFEVSTFFRIGSIDKTPVILSAAKDLAFGRVSGRSQEPGPSLRSG